MLRNGSFRETNLLQVVSAVRGLLPASWRVDVDQIDLGRGDRGADARLRVGPPAGASSTFWVHVASTPSTRGVLDRLLVLRSDLGESLLLVTDYASPVLRERLEQAGISYADATGWVMVRDDERGLFVRGQGSPRPPKSRERFEVDRLSGSATSRLIEELLVVGAGGGPGGVDRPWGVRQLAERAAVSPGTVAKVLPTLVRAGALDRDEAGAVIVVRKRSLLRRWVQDYGFTTTNKDLEHMLAPRGVAWLLDRLDGIGDVAQTGVGAGVEYLRAGSVPVVPVQRVALYVGDPLAATTALQLVPTDKAAANCLLVRPSDPTLMTRTVVLSDRRRLAPLPRVLADLSTLPGREAALAEQIIDQLELNDPAWSRA